MKPRSAWTVFFPLATSGSVCHCGDYCDDTTLLCVQTVTATRTATCLWRTTRAAPTPPRTPPTARTRRGRSLLRSAGKTWRPTWEREHRHRVRTLYCSHLCNVAPESVSVDQFFRLVVVGNDLSDVHNLVSLALLPPSTRLDEVMLSVVCLLAQLH